MGREWPPAVPMTRLIRGPADSAVVERLCVDLAVCAELVNFQDLEMLMVFEVRHLAESCWYLKSAGRCRAWSPEPPSVLLLALDRRAQGLDASLDLTRLSVFIELFQLFQRLGILARSVEHQG